MDKALFDRAVDSVSLLKDFVGCADESDIKRYILDVIRGCNDTDYELPRHLPDLSAFKYMDDVARQEYFAKLVDFFGIDHNAGFRFRRRAENYDPSMPIRLWVGNLGKYNEGELVGEWISLPYDEDEWEEMLERIGIGSQVDPDDPSYGVYEEIFCADSESDIPGLKIGEYPDYDELNEIAREWDELDFDQQESVGIRMDMLGEDIDDAIANADDVRIWHGCVDMRDVAYEFLDETGGIAELSKDDLERYFDYEAYGRDLEIYGCFDYSEELGCMVECY